MDGYLLLAAVLVGAGILLFVAEFLLPTGGVLLVAGLAAWAAAVLVVVLNGTATEASVAVVGLALGVPIAGSLAVWAWQRMARRVGLKPTEGTAVDAPELEELAALKGRYGATATPMRPSGAVVIDGRRVDALTEGLMLDAGVPVRCVDVRAGRVIVRRADAAPKLTDLTFDDPT
jgi:membrane-bound serine protease (ClpP class)